MSHADIGTRMRCLRQEAGYTMEEVAFRLGMTVQMVMQIERGTKQLSLLNAAKLSTMFGCTIDDLLGGNHERETGNA